MSQDLVEVLVVGGGGREHAIAVKLNESPRVKHVYCAPGNGGTAAEQNMTNVAIADSDIGGLLKLATEKKVALVFVGPEAPLCAGLADACKTAGIPCFGPSKQAAELESSKAFSKDFFARHSLPTAAFRNFKRNEYEAARSYVKAEYTSGREVVVKASGLAAGKGVLMPESVDEALEAVKTVMLDDAFGAAGDEVVIEQLLCGEECSCMAFADGCIASMMLPAQDHKRALDGDRGLNTGGMGAYAPAPCLTPRLQREVEVILQRTVEAMAKDGRKYIGVLYGGFILTQEGPMLLEYNCRFGDPETEVLLPLMDSDLFEVALGCAEGNLRARVPQVAWKAEAAATVVCAAKGYPGSYPKGLPISGLEEANTMAGIKVYHAGTKKTEAGLVSSGGRVMTVTGTGVDFNDAIRRAYQAVAKVRFDPTDGLHFRKDIGHRALYKPTRVALIGSTRGSSSQVMLDSIRAGTLNAEVVLVVSNKADAGILERAKREGIRHVHLPCAKGTSRAEYDAGLTQLLRDEDVDLVLLVGFMRILSPDFCRDWESRCLNIHPSLLPKHAGGMDLEVHKAVLDAGETETGCTVHFVTEVVDGGACFVQRRVQVQAGDTPETLKTRVQAEEGTALHEAVRLFGEVVLPAMSAAVRQDRKRKRSID
jgi:phosphoribosylamine--glycine ligase/phosphoribosylglycinamide formyltransferase/phosphoribosylformylglycinamidine cyclo-ligase/phosphoribosylamine--glycine ligase/phosphoribosylformylglycinamidine cyclo-ligase